MKHKLKQVMLERDAAKHLSGRVEIDDAYVGGQRGGGKRGRGAPGKTPFVAAVETTPDGKPSRLKLRRVGSFCSRSIEAFARASLDPACVVVTDGLRCFSAVTEAGCTHEVVTTGSGQRRRNRHPSDGSTRRSETSRPPSLAPPDPSTASTCRATSPNSNTASTDDTTSPR